MAVARFSSVSNLSFLSAWKYGEFSTQWNSWSRSWSWNIKHSRVPSSACFLWLSLSDRFLHHCITSSLHPIYFHGSPGAWATSRRCRRRQCTSNGELPSTRALDKKLNNQRHGKTKHVLKEVTLIKTMLWSTIVLLRNNSSAEFLGRVIQFNELSQQSVFSVRSTLKKKNRTQKCSNLSFPFLQRISMFSSRINFS